MGIKAYSKVNIKYFKSLAYDSITEKILILITKNSKSPSALLKNSLSCFRGSYGIRGHAA
jgi:hypothetical protein